MPEETVKSGTNPQVRTPFRRKTACAGTLAIYRRDMATVLPLKKMSRAEKLRAMEAIWTDLTQDEHQFESPAWHANALREAERAVESGTAKFVDWEDAKKRLLRKAAKLA